MSTTIEISPELNQFLDELVESGVYPTRGEVVREALELLKDREFLRNHKLQSLRRDIAVAEEEVRNGKVKSYRPKEHHALMQSIKAEGRKRLAAEKKKRANGA